MNFVSRDRKHVCSVLHSHSASPHPGIQIGNNKFNAGGNPEMDKHPIRGGGGGRNTPNCIILLKLEISVGLLIGQLDRMQS